MNRPRRILPTLFLLSLLGVSPLFAQDVLTVRVESLDALFADVDTLAVAFGEEPGAGDKLLGMAQGMLQLPSLDWVDRTRPLTLTLPLQGLMFGQKGFVGALPVADAEAAVAVLKESVEGVTTDDDGVLHVPVGEGEMLFVARSGYLLFGQNANLLGGYDPHPALAGAALPPGTLAVELNVDSVRAMIGMALQGAGQQIATMVAAGEEGAEGEDGGPSPEVDQAVRTVVGAIETLVANTSRLQLSMELSGGHLLVHNHYLPTTGSTLAEFLAAQDTKRMTPLARLLDGDDAAMTMVSNFTFTEAMQQGLAAFVAGYGEMLSAVTAGVPDASNPFGEIFPSMMRDAAAYIGCWDGQAAQVAHWDGGFRMEQVQGLASGENCLGMAEKLGGMMSALEVAEDSPMKFDVSRGTHRGLAYVSASMDLSAMFEGIEQDQTEEEAEIARGVLEGVWGGTEITTSYVQVGSTLVTTTGPGGEERLHALIDRVSDHGSGSGIPEDAFAPFAVGAGVYASMNLASFAELVPGTGEGSEVEEMREIFSALGPITIGVDFRRDALAAAAAISIDGLARVAAIAAEAADAEAEVADVETEAPAAEQEEPE